MTQMSAFTKLKVPVALLLTSGVVATTLMVSHGDVSETTSSSVASLAQTIKENKARAIGKVDYLPDVLGRIGYAVLMAEQKQINNIRNYQLPSPRMIYDDGSVDAKVKDSLGRIKTHYTEPSIVESDSLILSKEDDTLANTSSEPLVVDAPVNGRPIKVTFNHGFDEPDDVFGVMNAKHGTGFMPYDGLATHDVAYLDPKKPGLSHSHVLSVKPKVEEPHLPIVEEPKVEEPHLPMVEEPNVEEPHLPIVEEPKVKEPKVKEPHLPIVEEPKVEEPHLPIVDEPKVEEPHLPIVEEPKVEEPHLPIVEEPKVKEPHLPIVEEPKVEEPHLPIVEEPKVEEPHLPIVEEPKVEEPHLPIVEEPKVKEPHLPIVEEPKVEEPHLPIVEEPHLPIVEEPKVKEPHLPIVEEPKVEEPHLPIVEEPKVGEPHLPSDIPSELPDLPSDIPSELPDLPSDIPSELPDLPSDVSSELPDLPSDIPSELPDLPSDVPSELPDFPSDIPSKLPDLPSDVPSELPDFSSDIPDWGDAPNNPGTDWDSIPSSHLPAEPHAEPLKPTNKDNHDNGGVTVKFRSETVVVKQGQKTVYDPNMTKGHTRVEKGSPGQIIKSYKDTYYNGELSYSTLVEEETSVEPILDILYVGSKVGDTSAKIVDHKAGDTLGRYKILDYEGDIKAFLDKSYRDLLSESEDVRYEKAMSKIDASYLALDPDEEEPFNRTYAWLGVNDDVVSIFNSTNMIDNKKVNEYLVNYINMDRETRGLKKLKYDPTLQPLTETRAQEMADYGHIRYKGKPHTRPDGTPWTTVLDQLPTSYKSFGFGENMLAYSVLSNPYQLVSEQWIAKRLFEQWKSSGPHYAAMMNPEYTRTAVSVKLTTRTGAKSENGTNWMIGAELFS